MNPSSALHNQKPRNVEVSSHAENIPWSVATIVVVGALLTAIGAVIALARPAMMASPHDAINGAVRIYAGYLAARNGAIALMLIVLLALRARHALANLMVLVGVIQLFDVCMDCIEKRWAIVPGVLLIGLLYLWGAARLSAPFWRREAWTR